ncbi:MAG TPA: ABC transporter permease subunit [Polyangiaceae bacterium]|nr:ABC transporter permease subunit [Polyangiaceae bacterium]
MRHALGRLLGIVLTLAVTSVLAFSALSSLASALGPPSAGRTLPLFLNTHPPNVHDLARTAVQRIALGRDPELGKRELQRLGGAALPHVLPLFDTLNPTRRGEVALALSPVARRMRMASEQELTTAAEAIAFWSRFWQDRAFDFRPQIVRRLVARLADGSSALVQEDIVQLDTYAAPELIRALGRVRTPEDMLRARRITQVLSHVFERGPVVEPERGVTEARSAARAWHRHWSAEGADYVTLDGPRRVTAMFSETRYGKWAARAFGIIGPRGRDLGSPFGLTSAAALGTLGRYLLALGGALLLTAAWMRAELAAPKRRIWLWRALASGLAALPVAWLAAGFGTELSSSARSVLSIALVLFTSAAIISRQALPGLSETEGRTRPGWRLVLQAALQATPAALPWFATSLFALELWLELDGAASTVIRGLRRSDASPGMSVAIAGVLLGAAVATLADTSAARMAPSTRSPALVEVHGLFQRRVTRLALTSAIVLALLGSAHLVSASAAQPGWRELSAGARALLGYGCLTLLTAALVGLALGALAASGQRSFDALLVRSSELASALPAFLWAAALALWLGGGAALAVALGLLRAIDVAWLLRSSLRGQGLRDAELAVRSLGRYPLQQYWRLRLRPAGFPALAALALTPAWGIALAATAHLARLPATPGETGWGALLTAGTAQMGTFPRFSAAALLAALTAVLLALVTFAPRRLGALRSSFPPSPEGEDHTGRSGLASRR